MGLRIIHLLLCVACGLGHVLSLQILHTFRDPEDHAFQRIAIHDSTGAVFIGATNRLRKLTANLTLVQSAETGPREDNPDCPPPILPCAKSKSSTDSLTKGLVINPDADTIILCTSLFHGSCQTLKLSDITSATNHVKNSIVPNDNSSCVLFLAQGSQNKPSLYIGAEYSTLGDKTYRNIVPSISSRDVDSLEFASRDSEGGTRMSIKPDLRTDFKVTFVYGFADSEFVYFITRQKKDSKASEMVTRISRLCEKDRYFRSYVEIPLGCQHDATFTARVAQAASVMEGGRLAVSFSSDSHGGPDSSAVCIYTLADLNKLFDETVQKCYDGQGKVGPSHYETIRTCMRTSRPVDLCASTQTSQAYPALEGYTPLEASALLYVPDLKITSLRAVQESGHDIVHAGTMTGYIVKILVGKNQATEIERLHLGISEPVLDILNSQLEERIYALTTTKAFLLSTNHCENRKSCEECVDGIDPLCGWCVMEEHCILKQACPASAFEPSWLSAKQNTCLNITDVSPTVISYQALGQSTNPDKVLKFSLESVRLTPSSDLDLSCLYKSGEKQHRTPASIKLDRHVSCPLPQAAKLAQMPQGKDHENVAVHFHVKGKSIVTRSVSVYNCGTHNSCGTCTNSSFSCTWCYTTGKCVEPKAVCLNKNGSTTTLINSPGNCPQIWIQTKDSGIIVHSGQETQIAVRVTNLQADQNTNVKCSFAHSGKTQVVDGTITYLTLTCNSVELSFDGESPYTIADFKVTWGPLNLPFDNPNGIQVRIYKCMHMVTYCGQCLSMDAEYECGWCGGKCTLQRQCATNWLDRSATCSNPQITRFSPATGPVKGTTMVMVTGINLGKAYTEITAEVAGKPCTIKSDHYQAATRFLCEVGQVEVETSGIISVTVAGKYKAESDSEFAFVDPVLTTLIPKSGPKSGGITLTLIGDHLDAGSDTTVKMDGGICAVLKQNKTTLECTIPPQPSKNTEVRVEVSFGGYRKEVTETFIYKPDPTVSRIEPLKTIMSGGTSITVLGDGLNLTQRPEFFTSYGGKFFKETCDATNANVMMCRVPAVSAPAVSVTETSPLEIHYGFTMANVASLKNVSHNASFGPLMYYPDPYVAAFEEDDRTKPFQDDGLLSIQGRFHMMNALMASVHVYVGDELCSQTSANDMAITCKPPKTTPKGTEITGIAPVIVKIGNMRSVPGYLRYYSPVENNKPIALGVVLGVVLPIIFIVVLLTICVLRRHRKHKPDQNYIPDVLKDYEGKKEGEEEMIGMDNLPIKVDMNGGQMDKNSDSTPYISELLGKFEEPVLKQSIAAALISRRKLEIGDLVGKGNYGVVYKAVYSHLESDKQAEVAVKTLQAHRSEVEALQQFLQDVAMVRDLSHPHLLRVVGAVVSPSDDPIVVMPFMATEDLGTYVREPAKSLSLADLLIYCNQIADAMAYLENLRIVHRTLAARNCIIIEEEGKQASIKLTDYVVTASLFTKEFYVAEDGTVSELVRWMAPEAVENFTFSSPSDVWSFGVVMWEVLTRGVEPYPNTLPNGVITLVKSGKKLPKPKQCPENVYQIMVTCWSLMPQSRPTFVRLMEQLGPYVVGGNQECGQESQPLTASVEVGGADEYKELFE